MNEPAYEAALGEAAQAVAALVTSFKAGGDAPERALALIRTFILSAASGAIHHEMPRVIFDKMVEAVWQRAQELHREESKLQ